MADETNVNRRVWNSLEAAKIAASIATTLAVFALGYCVSLEDQERQGMLRNEAMTREAAAQSAALAREKQIRSQNQDDARLASEAAFRREKQLRDEAHARDAALRAEARLAEDRVRHETRAEAVRERILNQRLRMWTEASPILAFVQNRLNEGVAKREIELGEVELLVKLAEANTLIDVYESYFSRHFVNIFRQHVQDCYDLRRVLTSRGDDREAIANAHRERVKSYRLLKQAAREELAVISPDR